MEFKNQAEKLDSMFKRLNQLDCKITNILSLNSIRDEYGLDRVTKSDLAFANFIDNESLEEHDSSHNFEDFDNQDVILINSIDKIIEDEIKTNKEISPECLHPTSDYDEKFFK